MLKILSEKEECRSTDITKTGIQLRTDFIDRQTRGILGDYKHFKRWKHDLPRHFDLMEPLRNRKKSLANMPPCEHLDSFVFPVLNEPIIY